MTGPGAALQRCVGDVEAFSRDHWGTGPLLRAGADPGGWAGLLDLGDVDHLVTETLLRMPAFRLVKDGTPLDPRAYTQTVRVGGAPVDRVVRPERVLDLFARGTTIVLQALHRTWAPVAAFCRELELALTHPAQANAYVTPATSRGFAVHHDTHDVFVLQTHGHKAWRIYEPKVRLPGKEQPWRSKEMGEPGEPILEAELAPGDCLYVPRGFLHDAEAREEVSIHVTIGILAYTWLDLWRAAMDRAPENRAFREALPIGWAGDVDAPAGELADRRKAFEEWFEENASRDALERLARRFLRSRRPLLAGQMAQLERLRAGGVDAGSRFRRRPGTVFEVRSDERTEEAAVLLGTRELRMPAFALPALRFVAAATGGFTVDDLPDGLDAASRLVLLRRLVREGAVEVVG